MKGEKRNLGSIRYFGEQSLRIIGKERERERRKRGGVRRSGCLSKKRLFEGNEASLIPSSELGQRAGSRFYGSAHVNRDRSTLISIARAR